MTDQVGWPSPILWNNSPEQWKKHGPKRLFRGFIDRGWNTTQFLLGDEILPSIFLWDEILPSFFCGMKYYRFFFKGDEILPSFFRGWNTTQLYSIPIKQKIYVIDNGKSESFLVAHLGLDWISIGCGWLVSPFFWSVKRVVWKNSGEKKHEKKQILGKLWVPQDCRFHF